MTSALIHPATSFRSLLALRLRIRPPFSASYGTTQDQSLYSSAFGGSPYGELNAVWFTWAILTFAEFTGQLLLDRSNCAPANVFQPANSMFSFGPDVNTHFETTNTNGIYDQQYQFPSGQPLPASRPGGFHPPSSDMISSRR